MLSLMSTTSNLLEQKVAVSLGWCFHTISTIPLYIDYCCGQSSIAHSMFRSAFCDFGKSFTVNDTTGEQPLSGMVAGITKV
jgi:hypothetical protein